MLAHALGQRASVSTMHRDDIGRLTRVDTADGRVSFFVVVVLLVVEVIVGRQPVMRQQVSSVLDARDRGDTGELNMYAKFMVSFASLNSL